MPFGNPGILSLTFAHERPPSRDTCRLPSSVPAYATPARFADSANEMIVGHAWMPSSLAMRMSLPLTPIVTMSSRFALVVRSLPAVSKFNPRLADRNTLLAAA